MTQTTPCASRFICYDSCLCVYEFQTCLLAKRRRNKASAISFPVKISTRSVVRLISIDCLTRVSANPVPAEERNRLNLFRKPVLRGTQCLQRNKSTPAEFVFGVSARSYTSLLLRASLKIVSGYSDSVNFVL
jgi:hypothetical protein